MCRRIIWIDGSADLGRLQGTLPAPGGPSSRVRTVAAERECQAYRAVLEAEQQELIASASALSTTTTYGSHTRFFIEFCEQTGIDPEKFATHSLRIGGATTLFEQEGAEAVKALGGWASEVFRHYVHIAPEQRSAYVRRMGQQCASGAVPYRNLPIGRVR